MSKNLEDLIEKAVKYLLQELGNMKIDTSSLEVEKIRDAWKGEKYYRFYSWEFEFAGATCKLEFYTGRLGTNFLVWSKNGERDEELTRLFDRGIRELDWGGWEEEAE